jgi:pyrimidine-specific ribonucleoside hydrolase
LDAEGFQVLLGAGVPLVLAPWEISSKVWIREPDLKRLRASNASLGWILDAAEDWLAYWKKHLAADGFNPFDTLAVGYAISSQGFGCETLPVKIERQADDTVRQENAPQKPYLIAGKSVVSRTSALYCSEPPPLFAKTLLRLIER